MPIRIPLILNLRRDLYDRAPITSNIDCDGCSTTFLRVPAQTFVRRFLEPFGEFPPQQNADRFSLDQVMEKLSTSGAR